MKYAIISILALMLMPAVSMAGHPGGSRWGFSIGYGYNNGWESGRISFGYSNGGWGGSGYARSYPQHRPRYDYRPVYPRYQPVYVPRNYYAPSCAPAYNYRPSYRYYGGYRYGCYGGW